VGDKMNFDELKKVGLDEKNISSLEKNISYDNVINLAEDTVPTWKVSIKMKKSQIEDVGDICDEIAFNSKSANFFLRCNKPWNYVDEFVNSLISSKDSYNNIEGCSMNHEISYLKINDLAKIMKAHPFSKQLSSNSKEKTIEIKDAQTFQNYFITGYCMNLIIDSLSKTRLPPTYYGLHELKEKTSDFGNLILSKFKNAILINEAISGISFTVIKDGKLVLPLPEYKYSPKNYFVDYYSIMKENRHSNYQNIMSVSLQNPTIFLMKGNYYGYHWQEKENFLVNQVTDLIYEVPKNTDPNNFYTDGIKNYRSSKKLYDESMRDALLKKIKNINKAPARNYYYDDKIMSDEELTDRLMETFDL
jgi:hypothetical protein